MASWFEALCARDDVTQEAFPPSAQYPASVDRHHARLAIEQMREALREAVKLALAYDTDEAKMIAADLQEALALLDAEAPPMDEKE